jgi:hypothetical protein
LTFIDVSTFTAKASDSAVRFIDCILQITTC